MVDVNTELEQVDTGAPPPEVEEVISDGPGSGRSRLREDLEKNFEADRKATRPQARAPQKSRARQEMEQGEEQQETAPTEVAVADNTPTETQLNPPEAWAKEAKAVWATVPPIAQQAILKREEDTAKGVQAIQAKYNELDQILTPRSELFRAYNKTPAQAVKQIFEWFDVLGQNPDHGFPALMQSFQYDPRRLIPWLNQILGQQPQQGQAQQQGQEQPAGEVPAPVQQYISGLEQKIAHLTNAVAQKIGSLESNFAQQTQAKTQEILDAWARGKPYFEEVRMMMGKLIESGQVPALQNGGADLDKAYDMALWAQPEIRQKVLADIQAKKDADAQVKKEAERKAQREAAEKARRASGSLAPSAPGAPGSNLPKRGKGKSVGDSIREAIAEVQG